MEPLLDEFGWSTLALAAAFSFRSEVSAVASPVAGFLVDRFGPRSVMAAGVVVVAGGLVWLSTVGELWTFYASVCLVSVGTTFCSSQSSAIVIARWFRRQRSRALTFVTVGGAISGLTVPLLALTVSSLGWRAALMWWAAGTVAVCLPMTALVKNHPEEKGLRPDGDPPPAEASPVGGPVRGGLTLREAIRTRAFWFLALAMALSNFGTVVPFILLIPALSRAGFGPEISAMAAAAIPLVSLPGRVLFGFRGDYSDKRKLMAVGFGLQAVGIGLLAVATSLPLLIVFVVVFGTGFGAPLPLRSGIQADLFGLASLGSIQGMVNLATTLGGFFGPVVAGALVDLTGSYAPGFLAVAVAPALAVPLALAIRAPRSYDEPTAKTQEIVIC